MKGNQAWPVAVKLVHAQVENGTAPNSVGRAS
jgi:hypothetical protein